jgi:flagellar biosynthetic protein FliR
MLLPGIGEAELPATVRAALAVVLTLLLLPVLQPLLPVAPATPGATLALVAAETATGAWLGWLARLVMLALPLAGQVAASMLGLTNVLQPDVTLGPQTSSLARLFSAAGPVLLFATGLHVLPLSALVGSYTLIAPGALLPAGDMVQAAIGAVVGCFALSLQLAAPFVLAGAVWQIGLGVLGRLVPQLQVYFVALPGQILGGLLLLGLLSAAMLSAWRDAAAGVLTALPGL